MECTTGEFLLKVGGGRGVMPCNAMEWNAPRASSCSRSVAAHHLDNVHPFHYPTSLLRLTAPRVCVPSPSRGSSSARSARPPRRPKGLASSREGDDDDDAVCEARPRDRASRRAATWRPDGAGGGAPTTSGGASDARSAPVVATAREAAAVRVDTSEAKDEEEGGRMACARRGRSPPQAPQ